MTEEKKFVRFCTRCGSELKDIMNRFHPVTGEPVATFECPKYNFQYNHDSYDPIFVRVGNEVVVQWDMV